MNRISIVRLLATFIVFFLLLACSVSTSTPQPAQDVVNPVATNLPTETPLPQHQMLPGEPPGEGVYRSGDQDSSPNADKKAAPGGDRFTFGRFERPFNADSMDTYFPDLDIHDTNLVEDDVWIYASMTLESADAGGNLHGKYGFEIDADIDGGGDWLVMVTQPASQEWSTAGVQVFFDENNDVGGFPTVNADIPVSNGNGYETLLFDSDVGQDPDLAWSRLLPEEPVTLEFAVKRELLEGDDTYMVGMWAGTDDFDPALFDMNDHYTHEQAGAALPDFEYFYPIKSLSELDNSCRIPVGFQPLGNEPGSCPVAPVKNEPGASGSGSCQQTYCYFLGNQMYCVCIQ